MCDRNIQVRRLLVGEDVRRLEGPETVGLVPLQQPLLVIPHDKGEFRGEPLVVIEVAGFDPVDAIGIDAEAATAQAPAWYRSLS